MRLAKRMSTLAPYLFVQIEEKIDRARAEGHDVISLGIGDPDMPTPDHIVEVAKDSVAKPANHQYPSSRGMKSFRQSVAKYYERNYGVKLDADTEIGALIGSKEGIGHIAFCFTDPGDVNLIPNPGYPVYAAGIL